MCTERACSCTTTPNFSDHEFGENFCRVLRLIQKYQGEESEVFALRIAGLLEFAHCLIYKMSATFQELGLFDLQAKGWVGAKRGVSDREGFS